MPRFALLLLAILCAACGGPSGGRSASSARPGWIDHPPHIPGLVVASAQGPDRESAQQRAKHEVMAQIQVSVDASRSEQSQASEQVSTGTARSERWLRQMEERVTLNTRIADIPGLRIREEWRAPDGVSHALAELDRTAWAAGIRAELNDCDQRLLAAFQVYQHEEAAAPAHESPVTAALRLQRQLIPLLAERAGIVARLRLADPQGARLEAPFDIAAVESRLAQLLASITITVKPSVAAQVVAPELIQGLAAAGMPVVNDPAQAVLRIDLDLTTTVQPIDTQLRVDGVLEGRIHDLRAGRDLAGLRLRERASGTNEAIARSRLHERLGQALAQELDEAILGALSAKDG